MIQEIENKFSYVLSCIINPENKKLLVIKEKNRVGLPLLKLKESRHLSSQIRTTFSSIGIKVNGIEFLENFIWENKYPFIIVNIFSFSTNKLLDNFTFLSLNELLSKTKEKELTKLVLQVLSSANIL